MKKLLCNCGQEIDDLIGTEKLSDGSIHVTAICGGCNEAYSFNTFDGVEDSEDIKVMLSSECGLKLEG